MRLGRHGGMPSSELELIIARNGNFLSVIRAEGGQAGLYNSITGQYYGGIGGGWLPEYSRMLQPKYNCECTPNGACRSGLHGIKLIRGWRNLLHELLSRHRIRPTKEIKRIMGDREAMRAHDYGESGAPMNDPAPSWDYSSL